jgi:hypothetical protein
MLSSLFGREAFYGQKQVERITCRAEGRLSAMVDNLEGTAFGNGRRLAGYFGLLRNSTNFAAQNSGLEQSSQKAPKIACKPCRAQ